MKLRGATREMSGLSRTPGPLDVPVIPRVYREQGSTGRQAATPYGRRQKYEGTQAPLRISGGIVL